MDAAILDGIRPDELPDYLDWRRRVKGTNISEKTLLATDYLNHFNEIVMLIEMVPDMAMMFEECLAWQPKSYQQHFQESGFSDRDLAIAAYQRVPTKFRRPFEDTIEHLQIVVVFTLQRMSEAIAQDDQTQLRLDCDSAVQMLHRIIQIANGIIHGTTRVMEQEEIDLYLQLG
ncbi:MAG: hypothetical protein GC191_02120 [Azospirillum sp.]|nr:hypothetical protein [Azospirillum sp.]